MLSPRFLLEMLLAPFLALKVTIEFYTVGTVYSKINEEFVDSLYKNVWVYIKTHIGTILTKSDISFLNKPIESVWKEAKKNSVIAGNEFKGYEELFTERSYWLVRNEPVKGEVHTVLLFLHGGGYAFGLDEEQLIAMAVIHCSLPEEARKRLSVLVVDYSTTVDEKLYPTQIFETLQVYKRVAEEGYDNVGLIGDSAGCNLALVVSRYATYPEQAKAEFSKYHDFKFTYDPLPQPTFLILLSPWVDPLTSYEHAVKYDFGNPSMGVWYLGNLKLKNTQGWINLTDQLYDENMADIKALHGNTLVICGEQETIKKSISDWVKIVNDRQENVKLMIEPGGLHDCFSHIEVLDFVHKKNFEKPISDLVENKFCYSHIRDFLVDKLE